MLFFTSAAKHGVCLKHGDSFCAAKIAVKVINHYGDEVLKVYEVG